MKSILFSLCCLCMVKSFAQKQYLLLGTYDSPSSEGIYVYEFNSNDGSAKEISHVKTSNPSFLSISPNKKFVFAVNEKSDKNGKGGSVSSFAFNRKLGTLTAINVQSSEGNHPCYITVDKTGKWIIVGNYSSGNFGILPVDKNGVLQPAIQTIQMVGKSIDTIRQNSPHVHTTFFTKENDVLYVTDLGTDKIIGYSFNDKLGMVQPLRQPFISTEAGSGPRHMEISADGKFMYMVQELTGFAVVYSIKNKALKKLQSISTSQENFSGTPASADIHISPDGKFLYVSNRGDANNLAIYSIDKKSGLLSLIDHQSTLGLAPRNFNFDPSGKFLLVANQNSNEVVIFNRNAKSGLLKDTGKRIVVGKPVCIKWL